MVKSLLYHMRLGYCCLMKPILNGDDDFVMLLELKTFLSTCIYFDISFCKLFDVWVVAFELFTTNRCQFYVSRPLFKVRGAQDRAPKLMGSSYIHSVYTFRTANKNFSFSPWRRQRLQTRNSRSRPVLLLLCSFCGSNCP